MSSIFVECLGFCKTGGPFKPSFGLSGDVHLRA